MPEAVMSHQSSRGQDFAMAQLHKASFMWELITKDLGRRKGNYYELLFTTFYHTITLLGYLNFPHLFSIYSIVHSILHELLFIIYA